MSRRPAGDQGSVTVLILGFALVLILAIVGISAVSEVYLTRRSLAALSDDAALAGAQSLDQASVVVGEPGTRRRLDTAAVREAVAANLGQAGAGDLAGFSWSATTADGDTTVVVTVRARSRIGIASALFGTATVGVSERATAIATDHG